MSPEQLRGKDVGREADIYSLGATLYELLSGHPPFYQGDITYQTLNEEPEPLEEVSEEMNGVILRCLEKEKEKRFSDCEVLTIALQGKKTSNPPTNKQGTSKGEPKSEEIIFSEVVSRTDEQDIQCYVSNKSSLQPGVNDIDKNIKEIQTDHLSSEDNKKKSGWVALIIITLIVGVVFVGVIIATELLEIPSIVVWALVFVFAIIVGSIRNG